VLSISRAKLYKMMGQGDFPRPLKHGRISYWPIEDVTDWIEQEVAAARLTREELEQQQSANKAPKHRLSPNKPSQQPPQPRKGRGHSVSGANR